MTNIKQGNILAVELQCPNGHLTVEKEPYFELWTESSWGHDEYAVGDITVTCEGCGVEFEARLNG